MAQAILAQCTVGSTHWGLALSGPLPGARPCLHARRGRPAPMCDRFSDVVIGFVEAVQSAEDEEEGAESKQKKSKVDTTMEVSSHVLCLASPVFRAMLTSAEWEEGRSRRVAVPPSVGTRRGFAEFYAFLVPGSSCEKCVTDDNVDDVLALTDYYQVAALKNRCEQFLARTRPCSIPLLQQADKYGLAALRANCIEHLAADPDTDWTAFRDNPGMLWEITQGLRMAYRALHEVSKDRLRERDSWGRWQDPGSDADSERLGRQGAWDERW
uniref:BTB domain-containing protein n=1 Tax=Zooxanthella nutricula TaxID=1333877 RepID=A0A7S2LA71_9DINO